MDMLAKVLVVIILQHISVSKQLIVTPELMQVICQSPLNTTGQKQNKIFEVLPTFAYFLPIDHHLFASVICVPTW